MKIVPQNDFIEKIIKDAWFISWFGWILIHRKMDNNYVWQINELNAMKHWLFEF